MSGEHKIVGGASVDVKYDAEKLAVEAQAHIDKFRKQMKDIADECLGEIYVNCIPYIETDTWTNYREDLRIELQHEYKFSTFKLDWAVDFRRAVFVENREEISKLIEADILKRIKHLEDCRQEFDQYRYHPACDRYQDKVKELESEREKNRELKSWYDSTVAEYKKEREEQAQKYLDTANKYNDAVDKLIEEREKLAMCIQALDNAVYDCGLDSIVKGREVLSKIKESK